MRSATRTRDPLRALARAHGVQLSYTGHGGHRVRTSTDVLIATLDALGLVIDGARSIDDHLAEWGRQRTDQVLEPVVVLGHNGLLSSRVVVLAGTDLSKVHLIITREDGGTARRPLSGVVVGGSALPHDADFRALVIDLGELRVPVGYHEIAIEGGGYSADGLLLAPPDPVALSNREFGLFAPIYALRGADDWGVGTFTDLGRLADHAGRVGAYMVGTLPMFPIFFDPPVDPSPYLPVSRLFLNELFIDIGKLPEFGRSAGAHELVGGADFGADVTALSRLPKVDYGEVMARKRPVLQACADELFASTTPRRDSFDAFLAGHPELSSYADFRAASEGLGVRWRRWGTAPGKVPDEVIDPAARRYHLYAQFAASEQLAAAAVPASDRAALYLDLPIGVHPDGFDTWSQADLFAPATVGAPPDRMAPQGQAWGFPPVHPERVRQDRYRHVIGCYRHLLANAGAIRIDHILGFERLFWIPQGADPSAGAYVRYRSEELLAIVALEASRAGAVVVGEDLGTVSAEIRHSMDREGILHSFVYQFAASASNPLPEPRSPSLASLGSHDLPRFAAFWSGQDIDDRAARGVIDEATAQSERAERRALVAAVEAPLSERSIKDAHAACIGSLAGGSAAYVMVDLADLEGETQPDNRPGTGPEADNWRWRLARPLEQIIADDVVTDALSAIATQRRLAEPKE